MDYDVLLAQPLALLRREKRLSYRVLKRRFQLDDAVLEDLKQEPIEFLLEQAGGGGFRSDWQEVTIL